MTGTKEECSARCHHQRKGGDTERLLLGSVGSEGVIKREVKESAE